MCVWREATSERWFLRYTPSASAILSEPAKVVAARILLRESYREGPRSSRARWPTSPFGRRRRPRACAGFWPGWSLVPLAAERFEITRALPRGTSPPRPGPRAGSCSTRCCRRHRSGEPGCLVADGAGIPGTTMLENRAAPCHTASLVTVWLWVIAELLPAFNKFEHLWTIWMMLPEPRYPATIRNQAVASGPCRLQLALGRGGRSGALRL